MLPRVVFRINITLGNIVKESHLKDIWWSKNQKSMVEHFWKNSSQILAVNCFWKKPHHKCYTVLLVKKKETNYIILHTFM